MIAQSSLQRDSLPSNYHHIPDNVEPKFAATILSLHAEYVGSSLTASQHLKVTTKWSCICRTGELFIRERYIILSTPLSTPVIARSMMIHYTFKGS